MEYIGLNIAAEAAEDLSSYTGHFVAKDASTGKIRLLDSATEVPVGVLLNAPTAGQGATVATSGMVEVKANAALAIGATVGVEFVSATDCGKAAASGTGLVLGKVHVASGAEDDYVSVMLSIPSSGVKKTVTESLTLTANTTTRFGLYNVIRPCIVKGIKVSAYTLPADADGACSLLVKAYDSSATAEDSLLAATLNLETGLTAKTASNLTLTATSADLILAEGDTIFAELVNDSAAIDTAMVGGCITIEIEEF